MTLPARNHESEMHEASSLVANLSQLNSETLTSEFAESSILGRFGKTIDDRLLRGFTPLFFAPVMGTGVTSSLLYNFQYPSEWLKVCGIIMWGISIFLFLVGVASFMGALIKYPKTFASIHNNPEVAVFMGCLPMGYTTLVNFLYYLVKDRWIIGVYVLWWIAVFLSLYTACITFYFALLSKRSLVQNQVTSKQFHSTMLLPVVTLTVASASGGIIVPSLPTTNLKIITLIVSFVLWSNGIALGLNIILTLYFQKLFAHKSPATQLVFTTFLPIGLLGQASYSISLFGKNSFDLIMQHQHTLLNSPFLSYMKSYKSDIANESRLVCLIIGNSIISVTTLAALYLASFGYFMTFLAVTTSLSKVPPFTKNPNPKFTYTPSSNHFYSRIFHGSIKFNKTFWAMTFPLGTMALGNTGIYDTHNSFKAFKVIGACYSVAVIVIVIGCLSGLLYKIGILLISIIKGDTNRKGMNEVV